MQADRLVTSVLFRRLVALALGCLLAGGLAWAWWFHREAARRAEHEAQKSRIYELVGEHAREARAADPPAPAASARTPEARPYYLTPDIAAQLFPRDHSAETYDPWCYFHHVPNQSLEVAWPEHPKGRWHWVTNSLGLREDSELSVAKPDLRVLVTGDSHTDGFCDNAESFPHEAQSALARDRPGRTVEVINAGNGGFSFYNYLGVLERFLDLAPDAFVVAVYSGNDFQEVLIPHGWFEHVALPATTEAQRDELARLAARNGSANVQFFYSLAWFHQHPEAVETSLAAATGVVSRMRAICDERGIRLLCLLIPGAIDLPWGANAELYEKLRHETSMTEEDLGRNDRIADEFLARLEASGCDTLDARKILRAQAGPWFWTKDLHMNVRGHAALAQALAEKLESWGGRFAR
jgi:lysophospholipase L1-like esterase